MTASNDAGKPAGPTPGPWVRYDTPDYAEIHPAAGYQLSAIALVGRSEDANLIAAAPALLETLKELLHATCGETGFANAVRAVSGTAYPWPALDIAEERARALLSEIEP